MFPRVPSVFLLNPKKFLDPGRKLSLSYHTAAPNVVLDPRTCTEKAKRDPGKQCMNFQLGGLLYMALLRVFKLSGFTVAD